MRAAIELAGLEFSWSGEPLLQIEQLVIHAGESVFIRGASGSGKSTLLGLIGGVLVPARGQVRVLGTNLAALNHGARDQFRGDHLGFIFQMFNLIPYLSVVENVLLPARFSAARRARIPGNPLRAEALRLLAALGLSDGDLPDRRVTRLSMGQQQRVAAARALFGKPQIVMADEPTSALDADARADFLRLLIGECNAIDATLLFVSHDDSLQRHFDRTLDMADLAAAVRR